MTPQELKNSILQLAIQGKLVEQRPEEGTGDELYKRIQAEKKELIKAGKLKKEKPLPEITDDEIPFEIPESWKWIRVGNCVTNRTGLSYKKENLDVKTENMVRVLRGGNIGDTSYAIKPDDVMISDQFVKEDLFLKKNTIVTPAVTSIERIGKMGRIERDYTDTVVGGFVLMLLPIFDNDILSLFLLYTFSSKYFRDSCRGIVNKSGQAFYNLSRTKLMELLIPLPPLAEQKRIVAKIEELLPLVERYGEAWTKLEEFNKKFPDDVKKSILQQAIQGKLVEQRPEEGTGEELYQRIQAEKKELIKAGKLKKEKPLPEITDDEIPFEIPESWKWIRVGNCVTNRTGLSYKKENLDVKTENMVRVLRGGNIGDTSYAIKPDDVMISDQFVKEDLFLKKNTIVTPAVTSIERIGKMGRIERDYTDTVVGGFVLMLLPIFDNDILSLFLLYTFSSKYFRDSCRGIVNKSGQAFYNLSRTKLMELLIPLPPLAEQKRIVAKIEDLLPLCEKLKYYR